MSLINGERIAQGIEEELEEADPFLQIILVGDNEASRTFVEEKMEAAERLGYEAELKEFDDTVSEERLISCISELNEDETVHGILVQLPLPERIDNNNVFESIDPEKDVDGLHPDNLGRTLRGNPRIKPAAVEGIETILENELDLEGLEVTIINNSNLIGRPLAMVLTQKGATVTICHEYTEDLERHTDADVVVVATGEENLLTPDMISDETVVIDAGYGEGHGDVQQKDAISGKARLAAVPGGLGPVTVAITMRNLLKCFRLQE